MDLCDLTGEEDGGGMTVHDLTGEDDFSLLIPVELDGSSGTSPHKTGTNGPEKALDGDIATAWYARPFSYFQPGAPEKSAIWFTATVPHELAALLIYTSSDVCAPRFVEVEAEALGGGGFVQIASAELGRVRSWQRVAVPEGTAVAAAAWRVNINSTFGRIYRDFGGELVGDFPDVHEIRFVDRRLSTKPEEVA